MLPTIQFIRRLFTIEGMSDDDIRQEMLITLWTRVIPRWDPARAVGQFRSFAQLCFRRRCYSLVKYSLALKRLPPDTPLSLDMELGDDPDNVFTLIQDVPADTCAATASSAEHAEQQDEDPENMKLPVEFVDQAVTPTERIVLYLRMQGLSYSAIAKYIKDHNLTLLSARGKPLTGRTKCIDNILQNLRRRLDRTKRLNDEEML